MNGWMKNLIWSPWLKAPWTSATCILTWFAWIHLHIYINTITTMLCEAPAQLLHFSACWVFSCFRNPPNSDMDYKICILRTWSFLCACIHTGVGHIDSESAQHFCLWKTHKLFLHSWQDLNLGPLDPSSTLYQLSHLITPNVCNALISGYLPYPPIPYVCTFFISLSPFLICACVRAYVCTVCLYTRLFVQYFNCSTLPMSVYCLLLFRGGIGPKSKKRKILIG